MSVVLAAADLLAIWAALMSSQAACDRRQRLGYTIWPDDGRDHIVSVWPWTAHAVTMHPICGIAWVLTPGDLAAGQLTIRETAWDALGLAQGAVCTKCCRIAGRIEEA